MEDSCGMSSRRMILRLIGKQSALKKLLQVLRECSDCPLGNRLKHLHMQNGVGGLEMRQMLCPTNHLGLYTDPVIWANKQAPL